jgi:hypothetical protein
MLNSTRMLMYSHIATAQRAGIDLQPGDFRVIDGELTIDGMDAGEWLDAMTMD